MSPRYDRRRFVRSAVAVAAAATVPALPAVMPTVEAKTPAPMPITTSFHLPTSDECLAHLVEIAEQRGGTVTESEHRVKVELPTMMVTVGRESGSVVVFFPEPPEADRVGIISFCSMLANR